MIKAFIFDFDGVIINSENLWRERESAFLPSLIGKEVFKKIQKEILGSTLYTIYDIAKKNGSGVTQEEFYKVYNEEQAKIYQESPLTENIELLIEFLVKNDIKIGLVSATEGKEIRKVIGRLPLQNAFAIVISLGDRKDIRPKPFPDGYLQIMKQLGVDPSETVILEDSKKGVTAGKKSGAFVICFIQYLLSSLISDNADMYAKSIQDVVDYLKKNI